MPTRQPPSWDGVENPEDVSSWAAPEKPVMVRMLDVLLVNDDGDDVFLGGTRIGYADDDMTLFWGFGVASKAWTHLWLSVCPYGSRPWSLQAGLAGDMAFHLYL